MKVGLVGMSVLFALVFAEIALRIAIPEKQGYRVWPPGMHHTFHPNPAVMPMHSKETRFESNSLGLRGAEPGPDPEVRVLAIGGSTTENLYIDQEVAWALRIGKLLTSAKQRVWAASAGLSGMKPCQRMEPSGSRSGRAWPVRQRTPWRGSTTR